MLNFLPVQNECPSKSLRDIRDPRFSDIFVAQFTIATNAWHKDSLQRRANLVPVNSSNHGNWQAV